MSEARLTVFCHGCGKYHAPEVMATSKTGKTQYCLTCRSKADRYKRQPSRTINNGKQATEMYQAGKLPWRGRIE